MAAAAMVSVTMGVMKPVLEKLSTLMGDEYKKIKGLREEVSFLRDELPVMDALLEDMESVDRLDSLHKDWRRGIIDLSYDIEDCIDDFMHRVGEPGDKVSVLQKASDFLKTFKDRYHIANHTKMIKTKLFQTSKRRERYTHNVGTSATNPMANDTRLSALYKNSTSLVGIDTEKDELVNWVFDGVHQRKVASIVGFGGSGKSTLANEVYREVGGQFNCKALVSVSQTPDMTTLLNSLLLQIGLLPYSHVSEMDCINQISKHLEDKRYFIIIDDLWDIQPWKTIICAFPQNNHHSRVMVTTRHENVARSCSSNHRVTHNMKPLNEQDSKKLFFTRIFGSKDSCPAQFKEVSRQILKKCGGLPLAIINIASILACQHHPMLKNNWEQDTKLKKLWEYIQNCLATTKFESETYLKDMMYILDLSYKSLPRHLQSCFLYLGSYPEDHKISRDELVRRWVAEGFVSVSPEFDVWVLAESYFNELVHRSMIQPVYEYEDDLDSKVSSCRVHDMMLDLIRSKCKEYNFVTAVHGLQAMEEVQDKVRRVSVFFNGAEDVTIPVPTTRNLTKLRSLTISGGSNWILSLVKFKFVRILSLVFLEHPLVTDLTAISNLPLLKYLKIDRSNWEAGWLECPITLPSQIKGLRRLQTLEIPSFPVSNIPSDIVELPSLSHLVLPRVLSRSPDVVKGLPDGIGRMRSLRTLSCRGFNLLDSSPENIKSLGELTNLTELLLNCGTDNLPEYVPTEARMAALRSSLEKLSNLERLSLYPFRNNGCHGADMSLFSPTSSTIEKLHLIALTFTRVPIWIGHLLSLCALSLRVKEVPTCEANIDIIGNLPHLTYLELHIPGIPIERIVIGGSTGLFTALKRFYFDCDGPSYLTFEAGAMPNLRDLYFMVSPLTWNQGTPVGLEHLSSLKQIILYSKQSMDKVNAPGFSGATEDDRNETGPLRRAFEKAADAVPSRPIFLTISYRG